MSQAKQMFLLIQAPNTSKHISRNKGATMKASRKTVHGKGLFTLLGKKAIFFTLKRWHHQKGYGTESVYWYQCFSV